MHPSTSYIVKAAVTTTQAPLNIIQARLSLTLEVFPAN